MRIDLGFVWLCALALVALSATAFAVDITACGQYADNNTVYELVNNITTDGSTYGGYCLNMTGYNQTLNGNGYTLSSSNTTAGTAIKLSATGTAIYKVAINGFQYGFWLTTASSNNTIYYVKINGSAQGIRVVSNVSGGWNYFGYVYARNTTTGLYIANQGSNVFTNCDFNGSTDDINNVGTGTQFDNGFNYWDDCSGAGGCAWYTITGASATNERSGNDAPAPASAPTTNYGSSSTYGFHNENVYSYFMFTPAINHSTLGIVAPVFTLTKFGVWANIDSGVPLLVAYYANQSFAEGTITYNTRPTNTSTQIGSTFQPVLAYTQGWFTSSASALNLSAQYYFASSRNSVVYLYNSTSFAHNVLTVVFDENASGRPALNYTWHVANPNLNGTYSATHYVMALDGAGYCSIIYPTSSNPPVITDYFTGATQTLMYTGTANSTRNWTAWACSEGSIYQVNFTDPRPIITSATCDPQTSTMIANFTYYDESFGTAITANVSVVATGTTDLGTFNTTTTIGATAGFYICKPNWVATMDADFALTYFNATALTRYYNLAATHATNTNISLYLQQTTNSSLIQFKLRNQYGGELAGYKLQFLRYFPATMTYTLVSMGTTDASGDLQLPLYTTGGVYYKIYGYNPSDALVKTWNSELLTCAAGGSCEYTLYIESNYTEPIWWQEYGLVSWNCSFDNNKTTTCAWADITGESHTFNLTTKRIGITGVATVCSSSSMAASGTLYCVINDTNTSGSIYTMTFTRQSDLRVLDKHTYDFTNAAFLSIGALFAFLIIITCGLIGLTVPTVAPLMVVIGLVIAVWSGMLHIHAAAVATLVFAALVIMWKQGGN